MALLYAFIGLALFYIEFGYEPCTFFDWTSLFAPTNTVTARKAIDQRCSESNGLPKNEDTKLKKRRTFWERRKTHISPVTAFVTCSARVSQASGDVKINTPSLLG